MYSSAHPRTGGRTRCYHPHNLVPSPSFGETMPKQQGREGGCNHAYLERIVSTREGVNREFAFCKTCRRTWVLLGAKLK